MVRAFETASDGSDSDNSDFPMNYRFAIIGGGLTGTSLLCQLVDALERLGDAGRRSACGLAIDIFEKHPVVGPGLPHNGAYVLPFHITNMCARDMTVRIARPDDFQQWVRNNRDAASPRFDQQEVAFSVSSGVDEHCAHYPRQVMGEYLKSQFNGAAKKAKDIGVEVKIWSRCEVVDLWGEGTNIYLTSVDDQRVRKRVGPFQGALLATGHWFASSRIDNYLSSPWPAVKLLEVIPPGAEVGVIGSSLSAIETALTLSAEGRFQRLPSGRLSYEKPDKPRRLTLFSRQGLLPRVRGRIGQRRNRYFTCERLRRLMDERPNQLTLRELFQLIDRELSAAYGVQINWRQVVEPSGAPARVLEQDIDRAVKGDGPAGELVWQTVLVQIFPVVRELYLSLSAAERRLFDQQFNTLFFVHAATQPVSNAEKLLALMEAGVVGIQKLGRDYRFDFNESTGEFELYSIGTDGQCRLATFSFCVDARGQPRSIETDNSELTLNLLKRGLVQTERIPPADRAYTADSARGSILIDPDTHRVVHTDPENGDNANIELFAVGAMTRGQIIDASMAYGLARSTQTIANLLIKKLSDLRRLD